MKVADMIREMAPDWTAQDTRRATKYVHDMLETINTWDVSAVEDKLRELQKEDSVFAAVVWSMLPGPICNYLDAMNAAKRRTD